MENFTPIASTVGGALIGLASVLILKTQGRVAGVSGIAGSLLRPTPGDIAWRVAFTSALLAVGALALWAWPATVRVDHPPALPVAVVAGLLVGFGTRLGNGCTSGHGVCGISRLSMRSIVATMTFMVTAAATVLVARHVGGS